MLCFVEVKAWPEITDITFRASYIRAFDNALIRWQEPITAPAADF